MPEWDFRKMLIRSPSDNALERVHGYRKMAEHAQEQADAAELPRVKEAYQRSAERWATLANLVEMGDALPPPALAKPTGWRTAGRS
jgi:hypothetical protein